MHPCSCKTCDIVLDDGEFLPFYCKRIKTWMVEGDSRQPEYDKICKEGCVHHPLASKLLAMYITESEQILSDDDLTLRQGKEVRYYDKSFYSMGDDKFTLMIKVPGLGYYDYENLSYILNKLLYNHKKVEVKEDNW